MVLKHNLVVLPTRLDYDSKTTSTSTTFKYEIKLRKFKEFEQLIGD